jgi:hypothetical protein
VGRRGGEWDDGEESGTTGRRRSGQWDDENGRESGQWDGDENGKGDEKIGRTRAGRWGGEWDDEWVGNRAVGR